MSLSRSGALVFATARRQALIIAAVAALLSGCATPPAAQVKVIDSDAFRSSIRTIALVDISLPEDIAQAPHRDKLDTLVQDVLKRANFEFVRLEAAEWDKAVDQTGGLYDPKTGRTDPAKLDAAYEALLEAADSATTKAIDGVARPQVVVEGAKFYNYDAMWSGTSQPALTKGAAFSVVLGSRIIEGHLPALSIYLPIRNRSGETVFESLVGLELLQLCDAYLKFQPRPLEELFTDQERLDFTADLLWETLTGEKVVRQVTAPGIDHPRNDHRMP